MRSRIAMKILDETPPKVRTFVRKYGDTVVRVHQLSREGMEPERVGCQLE
jgi:hypothetical protein